MQTRTRKAVPCQGNLQTLHKQLNNDFDVHTYLHQHQLDLNNTEPYAQLLNSLVLARSTRTKYLQTLKILTTPDPPAQSSQHHLEFEAIEERTGIEGEITKNLQREITETKKSLNLLRGDIGFLVSRNETAQLLGSKVSKVKIVALDQLKRVSMALSKDKEEIKLRNEMQKKFGKKLKNISNYESTSLIRSKELHVDAHLRRNDVYRKLYSTNLAAHNTQEFALLLKQKELIDSNNIAQQLTLLQLASVITHFSPQDAQPPTNVTTLLQQIKDYLLELQLPDTPQEIQVNQAVQRILKEYHYLKDAIKGMTGFYNEQLTVKEELVSKMRECQHEQHELLLKFELEALYGYIITEDTLKSYNEKLKKFASVIKSYFKVLSYLERSEKPKENSNVEKRRYSSFQSESNIKYSAYITQLHKTHQLLSSDQLSPQIYNPSHSSPQQIGSFYQNLARDVRQWLCLLKAKISQGSYYPVERSAYHKPTTYSQSSQVFIPLQILYPEFKNQVSSKQTQQPQPVQCVSEQPVSNKAKRIRLLEDVDRDYYKMIKATMKMEKENTRKNYQFQRVFKRAKYASRDDILQEKRFEASFSVLFTKQSSPALTRAFGLQSRNSTQKYFPNSVHYSSQSSFKPKQSVAQPPKEIKAKMRRSLLEQREQKTRLNSKLREALEYSNV